MSSGQVFLSRNPLLKILPAALTMLAIFLFSAGSAVEVPHRLLGAILNKSGHIAGYGILALAFWRMFDFRGKRLWLAWLLAVLYALTDEYHQSFVPGRHPSLFDVLIYDNLGALISLWLAALFFRSGRFERGDPVLDDYREPQK